MLKLTAKNYRGVSQRSIREWPKYSTQLLNIANQNCKGTDIKLIGSMKELWLEMRGQGIRGTLSNWKKFYLSKKGKKVLKQSSEKVYDMLKKMKIHWIDEEMCHDYIKEMVFNKTHMGMAGEEMAVEAVAKYFKMKYHFSNAQEEAQGIDAWIGNVPVQVKPHDSVKKHHVRNHADVNKTLVITYESKKQICYVHNPERLTAV